MTTYSIEELVARAAITDALACYCRALDRMDRALADTVWHPDGTAHYIDLFEGTGAEFLDWVWQQHAAAERHSHQIANTLIEVEGDRAMSEAYVTVCLWTLPDANGDQLEIVARGRYLDFWSCRENRWAIDHRVHVMDTQSVNPLRAGAIGAASRRDPKDLSYVLFG